jgi:hypothetical protein
LQELVASSSNRLAILTPPVRQTLYPKMLNVARKTIFTIQSAPIDFESTPTTDLKGIP